MTKYYNLKLDPLFALMNSENVTKENKEEVLKELEFRGMDLRHRTNWEQV